MRKIIEYLRTNYTLVILVLLLLCVLAPYILTFAKYGLSSDVRDWASFGSYLGGVTVVISVFLAYKTYRDQSIANQRKFFEYSLRQKTDSILKRLQEYDADINNLCNDLLIPFLPIQTEKPSKEYPIICYEIALRRCYEYYTMNKDQYSTSVPAEHIHNSKHVEGIEDLILYVGEVFSFIRDFPLIDNKSIYISDVKALLSDELKVVMFYYVVSKTDNTLFHVFKEINVFKWNNMGNLLFLRTVELTCKSKNISLHSVFDKKSMIPDNGKDDLVESGNFLEIVDKISKMNYADRE